MNFLKNQFPEKLETSLFSLPKARAYLIEIRQEAEMN